GWTEWSLFGIVTLQKAMLLWSSSTILFGMARSMIRVAGARGATAVLPAAGHVAFGGAIVLAAHFDVISTITAVTLATGVNVYFGMRMLRNRLEGEPPRLARTLVVGTAILLALVAWSRYGAGPSPLVGLGLAVLASGVFAVNAIGDTRRSIVHLAASSVR